jgi:hypothetical protein
MMRIQRVSALQVAPKNEWCALEELRLGVDLGSSMRDSMIAAYPEWGARLWRAINGLSDQVIK